MTKDLCKNTIIAPMATAIWLIDNTSLSFKQIGDFCDFTEAEIKLIADGVIGNGVFALDPTKNGNLTKQEIYNREQDGKPLQNTFNALDGIDINIQKKKKYIPMLQRRSRPDAIFWLVNYCPELSDSQIIKLVRTTKNMVQSIRDKTYSEYKELVAKDPVVLGFCTQKNLNNEIEKAKEKLTKIEQQEQKKEKKMIRKINVNKVKVPKTNNTKKSNKSSLTKKGKSKNRNTKIKNKVSTKKNIKNKIEEKVKE